MIALKTVLLERMTHWPNGAVRSKEPLLNGKVHGMAVLTWDNGNIFRRIPFRNRLKHGRFEPFRRDGFRDQTLSYKDDRLHGKCIWYRTDGSLMAVDNRMSKEYVFLLDLNFVLFC